MFVLIQKQQPERFAFLIQRIVELYDLRNVCLQTYRNSRISLLFKKDTNFTGE